MNSVRIDYCSKCRWLLRAAWLAQEVMGTFEEEVSEVRLRKAEAGTFDIYLNDALLWSRKREGRFPEIKELKQAIRDRVSPERDLGHVDR